MKIITPGVFLLAALLTTACTDTEDTDTDTDDEGEPDVAACCAPTDPRGPDLVFDSFDVGRRARERFDLLQTLRSR